MRSEELTNPVGDLRSISPNVAETCGAMQSVSKLKSDSP
jgi:hypothetical protein